MLTFPGPGCLFLYFLSTNLPRTLQIRQRDPRNGGLQKDPGGSSQDVLLFFCKFVYFTPSNQPCIPRGVIWGGTASEDRQGVAIYWTSVCPSCDSFLNSKSAPRQLVVPICSHTSVGEILNLLYIVHPRQMHLVSVLRVLPFSCGRNLRKWKYHSFCFSLPHPHFAMLRSSGPWSIKGMKRSFGLCIWGMTGPVVMATIHPVSDSMRWGSMPVGMAPESSLPKLNGSSSKGYSPKEKPEYQWHPLSGAHKCLIN